MLCWTCRRESHRLIPFTGDVEAMVPHTNCNCHYTTFLPTRRSALAGLACTAVLPIASPLLATVAAAQSASEDERFMRMALEEARQGDFPFGAVIVRDGQVLARGRNLGRVT